MFSLMLLITTALVLASVDAAAAITKMSSTSKTSPSKTVTVTATHTKTAIHTKTVTVEPTCSTTITAEAAFFSVGFGADPLTVTGSGNYLGYSTPSNDSLRANSGKGYLKGNFGAAADIGKFDIFQISSDSVPVLPDTQYLFSIAALQTKGNNPNVFCFLYMTADNGQTGERWDLEGTKWATNSVIFITAFNQTTVDIQAYTNCENGSEGSVYVPYSVLFDDIKVLPYEYEE